MPEIEYGLTEYMFSMAKRCKRFPTPEAFISGLESDTQKQLTLKMRLDIGAKESGFKSFEDFFETAKIAKIRKPIKREYPDTYVHPKYKRIATIMVWSLITAMAIITLLLVIILLK